MFNQVKNKNQQVLMKFVDILVVKRFHSSYVSEEIIKSHFVNSIFVMAEDYGLIRKTFILNPFNALQAGWWDANRAVVQKLWE